MFSRPERLPRTAFPRGGRLPRRTGPHFSATLVPERGYAVVISKKTVPGSVDRHNLKRRTIGALKRPPTLPLPQGFIIYPKASARTLSAREIRTELEKLLSKAP